MSLKPLLAVFLFLVASVASAQEKFNLVFRYQPGGIYRYRTSDTFNSLQESNGQEMKFSGGNGSLMKMEVVSVAPDSAITFITSYEEMRANIKSGMMDTVIDQPEMIGKRTKIVLNRQGDEIERVVLDSMGHAGSKGFMNMIAGKVVNFFHLPVRPVATGEGWTGDIYDSTAFEGGYTTQTGSIAYTLNGYGEKNGHQCLKIDFSAKSDHAGKMKQMGMNVFIEGTGDTRGTIWFDQVAGILVQRESTAIQELTFAITGPMTMSMPMTQTIKSLYSLVEK